MTSSCNQILKGALTVMLLILLSGCVGPNKPDLSQKIPMSWEVALPVQGQPVSLRSWWKIFNDPTLDVLVNEALTNNLDIAQASQLLQKVYILGRVSKSVYLPSLSAGVRPAQDAPVRENFLHAFVNTAWELSLYGESANHAQIGEANILSTQAQEQGIRVAIVANVVQNYLNYLYAGQQLALVEHQQVIEKRMQTLAAVRETAHIGSSEERIASQLRVDELQAKIIDLEQVQEQSMRMLALLTMQTKMQMAKKLQAHSIVVPQIRIEQLPADLLRTRPDIRQAEAAVMHCAAEVGLAKASLYPHLALNGSLLYAYNLNDNYRKTSGNSTPNFGVVIDIPLWDWGQRQANKKAKEYELQAALLGYRKAVLDGIRETEDALSSLAYQDRHIKVLREVIEQQNGLTRIQYNLNKFGFSSEYEGLHSQIITFQMQSKLIEAQFKYALGFVTLYKALGGAPLSAMSKSFSRDVESSQ